MFYQIFIIIYKIFDIKLLNLKSYQIRKLGGDSNYINYKIAFQNNKRRFINKTNLTDIINNKIIIL
jgi:hypothetical protein